MNYIRLFLALLLLFTRTISVSRAQKLGPLDVCPVPKEFDECSDEAMDELSSTFGNQITDLENLYKGGDLDCEAQNPGDDKYDNCVQVQEAICKLGDSKKQTIEQMKETCDEKDKQMQIMDRVFAEAGRTLALIPDTQKEFCLTSDSDAAKTTATVVFALETSILVLELLLSSLETLKDSFDSVPLFGTAAGAPLAAAIILTNVLITGLQTAINLISLTTTETDLKDGDCFEDRGIVRTDLLFETFTFLEDLEEQVIEIQETADTVDGKVDIVDTVVDDNQLILDFLADPFSGDGINNRILKEETERMIVFFGAGCDNTDNDSDSTILDTFGINRTPQLIVKRIDECDEDLVPPTIVLVKDPPATFPSQEEGETWFMENTVVLDDCAPLARLNKFTIPSTTGQVTIKVVDIRCENMSIETAEVDGISRVVDGPGEPTATKTFTFVVDGNPPVITCGFFKPQDDNYVSDFGLFSIGDQTDPLFIDSVNEKGKLVNVKFFYQVEENPPNPGEKISIHIKVTSNEFEDYQYDNGRKMLTIIERNNLGGPPAPVDRATLLLAPFTCGDKTAGDTCLIEKDSTARFYEINLLATDSSGNVGETTCTVAVVPEYHYPKSKSSKSTTDRDLKSLEGKDSKGAPARPSRKSLIAELVRSKQRYVLHEAVVVWDTGLDEGVVTPAPTIAPTRSKSSKRTKERVIQVRRNK